MLLIQVITIELVSYQMAQENLFLQTATVVSLISHYQALFFDVNFFEFYPLVYKFH
jgi:hypothetical protein